MFGRDSGIRRIFQGWQVKTDREALYYALGAVRVLSRMLPPSGRVFKERLTSLGNELEAHLEGKVNALENEEAGKGDESGGGEIDAGHTPLSWPGLRESGPEES